MTLPLTPIVHPSVRSFLDTDMARDLVEACGSPLNILLPSVFAQNAVAFEAVLQSHSIRGHIRYACKANKSRAIAAQACASGIGIDVASLGELQKALGCGFTGSRIEATGPKNDEFLALALRHGCLVSVDDLSELEAIARLRTQLNIADPTPVLLRLTGFRDDGPNTKDSRFGMPIGTMPDVLTWLGMHRAGFDVRGVAFHLDTAALKEKVTAVGYCLDILETLREAGWEARILNIGGGFRTNYLAKHEEWHAYIGELQEGVLGRREALGWNGAGFGYRAENGQVRGGPAFYEYYVSLSGPAYLDELLSSEIPGRGGIGTYLSETMTELMIEPGRALLDQSGITLARVLFRKESASGQMMIGLDMNRSNLASLDQEMFIDPIVLPADDGKRTHDDRGVFLVGNLCLANDFIYRHRTFLPFLPERGDLLAFVNTAGYNGDFEESRTLEQPIARKVAVDLRNDRWRWFSDEHFSPMP
jgi:diaminopimelate decarboxylase